MVAGIVLAVMGCCCFLVWCLCAAAGRTDEKMESWQDNNET